MINNSRRLLRIPTLVSVVGFACLIYVSWLKVIDFSLSNRGFSNNEKSLSATLFRKRPVVIVTKDKLQPKSLAQAVEDSMQYRLSLVHEKCQAGWKPINDDLFKKMNLFYYDARRRLSYCHTAKVGCTFWLRIFTYLTRRKELQFHGITSPFMIERIHLHTGSLSPQTANFWPQFTQFVYDSSFRFLFARNPYSRLLSVYFDKFFLLGHSQTLFVPSLMCDNSKGIRFSEYLDFALSSDDHHLLPISDLCNPCEFKPHAIGKMETFKTDAQFILDKGNYGSLLRHYNHSYRVGIELDSIIGENFEYLADIQTRHGDTCMSAKSLSQRLWKVFQYNGYIHSDLTLPDVGISFTKYGVITYIKNMIQKHPLDEDQSIFQQKQYLYEFYSKIPKNKIKNIHTRYSGDFELFGYSKDAPKKPTLPTKTIK